MNYFNVSNLKDTQFEKLNNFLIRKIFKDYERNDEFCLTDKIERIQQLQESAQAGYIKLSEKFKVDLKARELQCRIFLEELEEDEDRDVLEFYQEQLANLPMIKSDEPDIIYLATPEFEI